MGKLIVLVFMVGSMGLVGIALFGFLRFLLLTLLVQVVGNAVRGALGLVKTALHALIFVFGTALVGAFIVGIGLQIITTLAADGAAADATMPTLVAFLVFFVLLAWRGWQWQARRNGSNAAQPVVSEATIPDDGTHTLELAPLPDGYEGVAGAWEKAIKLAPERGEELADAQASCAQLLAVVEQHESIPDGEIRETVVLIRKHLQALVDSTERRLRGASVAAKKATVEEMVKLLLGFGQRAQQDLEAAGLTPEEDDAVLRAHLAARLFR